MRRGNKYNAVRTQARDGRMYDSGKEAVFADELRLLQSSGEIVSYLPQVSIPIGSDENGRAVRYRVDFMVIQPGGTIVWYDVKGRDTQASRAKRAALRDHGIDVQVV